MTTRIAYHADESYYADGKFLLIRVTENEAGYDVAQGGFSTVEDALAVATRANDAAGLTANDVLDIRVSSMAVSNIAR